jgi:hypothetical protein
MGLSLQGLCLCSMDLWNYSHRCAVADLDEGGEEGTLYPDEADGGDQSNRPSSVDHDHAEHGEHAHDDREDFGDNDTNHLAVDQLDTRPTTSSTISVDGLDQTSTGGGWVGTVLDPSRKTSHALGSSTDLRPSTVTFANDAGHARAGSGDASSVLEVSSVHGDGTSTARNSEDVSAFVARRDSARKPRIRSAGKDGHAGLQNDSGTPAELVGMFSVLEGLHTRIITCDCIQQRTRLLLVLVLGCRSMTMTCCLPAHPCTV